MFASRASSDRTLTPRALVSSSGAKLLRDSWVARDARWIVTVASVYALAIVAATLTLNRYFSQTWDVTTFVQAARSFSGADWAGLYAQSRLERYWPYAYPPLHALAIAPLLTLSSFIPDWLLARVPPLLADVGVALLLYSIVARKTGDQSLSRIALVVWLLNPVTFYDTAVQGHFEAEWLFFVLLAYSLAETRTGVLLPTLALATGVLFKQTAILFAIPYWLWLIQREPSLRRGVSSALASLAIFAVPVLIVSLPFLLYSPDYVYMNLQYVAEVPLQTQSWLIALARFFTEASPLARSWNSLILVASAIISWFAIRRGHSLYLTALLIVLAFFLLSTKVVGYYYVMLFPLALVALLPARRSKLLALMVIATAWISISPYFASWADQNHWPIYAALGIINSILWLALFIYLWRDHPLPLLVKSKIPSAVEGEGGGEVSSPRTLLFISLALFLEAVSAALVQPLILDPTSPIRAPLIAQGSEAQTALAFVILLGLVLLALVTSAWFTRAFASGSMLPRSAVALALMFVPLYFLTFTLTKESTTALELALKSLGL